MAAGGPPATVLRGRVLLQDAHGHQNIFGGRSSAPACAWRRGSAQWSPQEYAARQRQWLPERRLHCVAGARRTTVVDEHTVLGLRAYCGPVCRAYNQGRAFNMTDLSSYDLGYYLVSDSVQQTILADCLNFAVAEVDLAWELASAERARPPGCRGGLEELSWMCLRCFTVKTRSETHSLDIQARNVENDSKKSQPSLFGHLSLRRSRGARSSSRSARGRARGGPLPAREGFDDHLARRRGRSLESTLWPSVPASAGRSRRRRRLEKLGGAFVGCGARLRNAHDPSGSCDHRCWWSSKLSVRMGGQMAVTHDAGSSCSLALWDGLLLLGLGR